MGDRCQRPVEVRRAYTGDPSTVTRWQPAEVVAVRGDRVVVRAYSWEYEHPWWELRVPPKPRPWGRR